MHMTCPHCQASFVATAPLTQCPRCGHEVLAPTRPGGYGGTQALDPAEIARVLSASAPPSPPVPGPFAVAPPRSPFDAPRPAPVAAPPAAPFGAPAFAPYHPPQPAMQPAAWAQPPLRAPYGQPTASVNERDLGGAAVVSVVLSLVSFLGGCNPLGLAGVVLGLIAYADVNAGRVDRAVGRARTARWLAVSSLLMTLVVWGAVAAWLFLG